MRPPHIERRVPASEGRNLKHGVSMMKYLLFVLPLIAVLAIGCGDKSQQKDGAKDEKPSTEKKKPRLKGEGYGDDPITAPLKARWTMERQLNASLLKKGLITYKAVEGHAPRNQKEFDQMVEVYEIMLPKPPEGFRHKWNVKEEKVEFVPVEK